MTFQFDGKHRALIVGGGGGIGASCVAEFAAAGASVTSLDLKLSMAEESIEGLAGCHRAMQADVSNPDSLQSIVEQIKGDSPFDSIVYCAGVTATSSVIEHDWNEYRRVMSINLDGAFYVAKAFCKTMVEAKSQGSVVFLSSMSGQRGESLASAYCASKFGLIGMMESFAAENTQHGIRANAVAPGNVDSPMLRNVAREISAETGQTAEEVWQELSHQGAAVRLVELTEVAQVCLWLASPLSSGVTGATIRVDAGQTLDW
jgi:NAD(P)-dependent dehydrogenase (short-subunit alcohol dehydrogenase family)